MAFSRGARFRLADPQRDVEGVLAVYTPIVRDTAISFEAEPPTPERLAALMMDTLRDWPWVVCEDDFGLLGYAYACRHRVRDAYAWAVDVSVYLASSARGCGLGRALYERLFALLRLLGYRNAFAGIALPNEASVGLHETMGFKPVGVYRNVGFKLGAWRDVGWWQLELLPCDAAPARPRPVGDVVDTPEWKAALQGAHL